MIIYEFDGTMTGVLSCIFRAFQFKDFDVRIVPKGMIQHHLFTEVIDVASNDEKAQRVWIALKKRVSSRAIRDFYYTFLSEHENAFQQLFNFAIYVFQSKNRIDTNYGHSAVLSLSQWAKQVGREKHRMEAFVRFKKCKNHVFVSLVRPDFNVLPLIERHFRTRYQDQKWLIYDEKRKFGIYYDLDQVHQIEMDANAIDRNLQTGFSQHFLIELDDDEVLYDQLWKDYFQRVNIVARSNLKLHIQYVPKRYWRYMNEKLL